MASIKDVAKRAGVSTATVSRVLSNNPYVSDEVRTKVEAAVSYLGYRPNRVAQGFRSQKSNIIALIVADIQNSFFSAIARSIQDNALKNEYNVFLCNTDEQLAKESSYLDLMKDENVAGIIIAPTHQTEASIQKIAKLDIPTVVIDRKVQLPEMDGVYVDNLGAASKLMTHMLEKGYRNIAAVIGSGSETGRQRYLGMIDAMQKFSLEIDNDIVHFIEARAETGYQATKQLLASGKKMDAILATNGLLGAGVFRALKESEVSIPEFGFACFDETVWTSLVDPHVTVMAQPTIDIGSTAVELLMKRIADKSIPFREVILQAKLIKRDSTNRK